MADFNAACVALVHRLADASGEIALAHFRTASLTVDDKSDASPVTIADRDAEAAMRDLIAKTFPNHGIIGEEHGRENVGAEYVWVLDPIDGTQSFINGVPLWGTLIGLMKNGSPWLGCINHAALSERWIGGAGQATTLNGKAAKPRACAALSDAVVYCTSLDYFENDEAARFARLEKAVKRRRVGGTDCYHYAMVASGWTDMACEAGLKLHDYAALVPVLDGAGAGIVSWNGAPLTLDSERSNPRGLVVAAGDKRTMAEAVKVLSA